MLTLEVKLGLPLGMLILGGGQIHTHFGSEVGITFGNADPGGGADPHSHWK